MGILSIYTLLITFTIHTLLYSIWSSSSLDSKTPLCQIEDTNFSDCLIPAYSSEYSGKDPALFFFTLLTQKTPTALQLEIAEQIAIEKGSQTR